MNPALETRKLVQLATTMGLETKVTKSNLSNSHYLTITNPADNATIRVRISNHDQVLMYQQQFDLEIGNHRKANCPETHSPKVLKKLVNLSGEHHQTDAILDAILSEWAKIAEQSTPSSEARGNAAEADIADQVTDTVRRGGAFSNKVIRSLIRETTLSNNLPPIQTTVLRIQEKVVEKLRQDQGQAVLTAAVLVTQEERETIKAEHKASEQRRTQAAREQLARLQAEKSVILENSMSAVRPFIQQAATIEAGIAAAHETGKTLQYGMEAVVRTLLEKYGMSKSEASKIVRRAIKARRSAEAVTTA